VTEGENYLFQPSASDPDGDSLNFSIANKPVWASFDASTGTLSGNPADGSAGLYSDITISVSDGELSDSLASFAIQVDEAPPTLVAGPPVLASANVVDSNIVLSWTMENTVPEGGYDIFIDGVDTGTQYRTNNLSTSLSGLDLTQSHCFMVESRYTDSREFYPSNQLCSEVQIPNQAPAISGSPATLVTEGESYLFKPSASDPDGDSLNFSIANKPAWASFDASTGTLSGNPADGSAGLYSGITISVSDGELSDSLASFAIQVEEAPQTLVAGPPVLASANVVDTNIMLSWTMENAIPEGGYDIFIDGVDTGNQYRTSNTSVSLSGLDLSQSHCFMVESRYTDTSEFYSSNQLCSEAQGSANQAPVISGTPSSTATVGANYSFTPTASDADGDSLSFSVSNLPAWASFDNQTGTLSGDPQSMDVGSYDNILISVSDGTDSSQLAAFSILVEEQAALASASLDWAAPSTREDGTALSLSEIDGYRIYMGDSASSLVAVMDINDYSITEYTLTGIQQGDHYFAVTAYDKAGSESGLSNIILKTCN
jgi:hypothetical protein